MSQNASADIRINVDYDGRGLRSASRDIDRLTRKNNALGSSGKKNENMLNTTMNKWKKHFDQFDKMTAMAGKMGLKAFSLALKGAALEIVALGAALVGIHAAFAAGQWLMKAYRATLGPIAAGMTAIVAAASVAAAAIRENQAAMWAYKTTSKGEFGSSMNQTRQVMRALHTDTYLATAGVENLNKAFGTVSKSSTWTMNSQNMLKGLMDFASAGQPIEQGIQKAADLIAIIQDTKKGFGQAKTAAQQLFPDKAKVDEAFKKLKINNKKSLESAITSGELAKAAGLEGQFEAVSGTLINKLKGYMTVLKNEFADIGQPMLAPVKDAAEKIFRIIQRGIVRISGATQNFGMGGMLDTLVNIVDKLTTKATDFINNNVKGSVGTFEKIGNWFSRFKDGWNSIVEKLRPMIDGARVIEKMFGRVWEHVKNAFSGKLGEFSDWLVANESTMMEFGDNVGELISNIIKMQGEVKKIVMAIMPFVSSVVEGISSMVSGITSFLKILNGGSGQFKALALIMGYKMTMGRMAGTKGGMIAQTTPMSAFGSQQYANQMRNGITGGGPGGIGGVAASNTSVMNVTASVVNINGGGGMSGGTPVAGGGALGTTGALFAPPGRPGGAGGAGGAGAPRTLGGFPVSPTMVVSHADPYAMNNAGVNQRSMRSMWGPNITPQSMMTSSPLFDDNGNRRRAEWYRGDRDYGTKIRREDGKFGKVGKLANKYGQSYYDNFVAQGMSEEERLDQRYAQGHKKEGQLTRKAKLARIKSFTRYQRTESRAGKAFGKFEGSMGAKMGAGMGMGFLASKGIGDKGSMALGSSLAMMSPTLGLAVGFGGTALKAKTAGGGALAGGIGGAALGAKLGGFTPLGPIGGAVVGALLGTVTGAVMGQINKHKAMAKAAGQAAKSAVSSMFNDVLGDTFRAVQREAGTKGRSSTRDIGKTFTERANKAREIIGNTPAERNVFGPDAFLGGRDNGGQLGLNIEHMTGKKMPKVVGRLVGSITTPIDAISNVLAGTVKFFGGKRLVNNKFLNPLGYGTDNRKDADRQRQEATVTKLFRRQSETGFKMTNKEYEDALKKPGKFLDTFTKEMANREKANGPIMKEYNSRLDDLGKITGKTDTEIVDLAKSMGVNLYDSTMSFTEVLEKLGLAMTRTAEEMNTAYINVITKSTDYFQKNIDAAKAPKILNEEFRKYRDMADASSGGVLDTESKNEFMKSIMEKNLAYFGGDTTKAFAQTMQTFKTDGTLYAKGGAFYGAKDQGMDVLFNDYIQNSGVMSGLAGESSSQLNAILNDSGISVTAKDLEAAMAGMDDAQMQKFLEASINGFQLPGGRQGMDLKDKYGATAILEYLGIGDMKTEKFDKAARDKAATDLTTASKDIASATTTLIDELGTFFKDNQGQPTWMTTPPDWWNKDDTMTPRGSTIGDTTSSRLSQTMGRHAAMDGMLTGSRTITSSYRNYGLGSINSDHVTGRAYDLVGQNLGQYSSLVSAGGGFAEFHGVGGDRHLHVVPGPGIGDTMTPVSNAKSMAMPTLTTSGGGNSYTIHVNGGKDSAEQIAQAVMQRIRSEERSNRERI